MKMGWNSGVTFESYQLGRCFKNLEWNILNCGGFIEYRGQYCVPVNMAGNFGIP
jgi:hypothetical protein